MKDKQELIKEITEALDELNKLDASGQGSLLVYGDLEKSLATVDTKGNMQVLSMAFGNMMDNKEEFNRLMLSVFGSYLANNEKHKEMFISALGIGGFNLGSN